MKNLAKILIKNYPKEITLDDGTAVTVRLLLKDDESALLAYFQSLAPEERVELKEDVTDPKVIEKWMENLDYDLMLPMVALHEGRIVGAASLRFSPSAWTRPNASFVMPEAMLGASPRLSCHDVVRLA